MPATTWDDLRPHRMIDFQRAGVALFLAGVLALGVGVATGGKADGKSTPAPGFTPVAQVVAPSNAGPDVPPAAPANGAPASVPNNAPPAPASGNPAPPAPG